MPRLTTTEYRETIRASENWQNSSSAKTIVQRRILKERAVAEICGTRLGKSKIKDNPKTGGAIGGVVSECQPTSICAKYCYACQGPSAFIDGINADVEMHFSILDAPIDTAIELHREWQFKMYGQPLRFSATGELSSRREYRQFFQKCFDLGVPFYGYTKRIDVHQMLRTIGYEVMFSLDDSSPNYSWDYARLHVAEHKRAFQRTLANEDPRIPCGVVFPTHGPGKATWLDRIKQDTADCPAIRDKEVGCHQCRRCF